MLVVCQIASARLVVSALRPVASALSLSMKRFCQGMAFSCTARQCVAGYFGDSVCVHCFRTFRQRGGTVFSGAKKLHSQGLHAAGRWCRQLPSSLILRLQVVRGSGLVVRWKIVRPSQSFSGVAVANATSYKCCEAELARRRAPSDTASQRR